MEVKATLVPGENGTKSLVREYGDRLVCVRYRYDKERQKRFKTIELIVDEQHWSATLDKRKVVCIQLDEHEHELRMRVKSAGGNWQDDLQSWSMDYQTALELGLEARIMPVVPDKPSE